MPTPAVPKRSASGFSFIQDTKRRKSVQPFRRCASLLTQHTTVPALIWLIGAKSLSGSNGSLL